MKAGEIAILILPPKLKLRGSASAVYAEASNCRQRRSWGGGSKLGDWSKRELLLLHLAYGNLHCSFSELEGSSVKQSRPYSTFHCRWISEVLCMHCQGIRVFAGGEAKAESESSWNWAAMRALLYGVWWSRLQRACEVYFRLRHSMPSVHSQCSSQLPAPHMTCRFPKHVSSNVGPVLCHCSVGWVPQGSPVLPPYSAVWGFIFSENILFVLSH